MCSIIFKLAASFMKFSFFIGGTMFLISFLNAEPLFHKLFLFNFYNYRAWKFQFLYVQVESSAISRNITWTNIDGMFKYLMKNHACFVANLNQVSNLKGSLKYLCDKGNKKEHIDKNAASFKLSEHIF